uniref:Chromo domain-containing protein n=1 Tax=Ananas comosus var. bracteatus TaxID=296719 RepID=A0A6V7Q3B3_ANACO|nr:unnamed protein product [Ananas comosus var. bracteatus]
MWHRLPLVSVNQLSTPLGFALNLDEESEIWTLAFGSTWVRENQLKGLSSKRGFEMEFLVGDHVSLKVSPTRGIRRFGTRGKLSPRFIGPYEILERVGLVAYRLALPPNLSGIHDIFYVSVLRKCIFDPAYVLDATPIELQDDLTFEEQPVRILAREVRKLRNRDFPYVKVLWSNHEEREATWELESALQERYPHLFQMES